jgi:hypothetical protein
MSEDVKSIVQQVGEQVALKICVIGVGNAGNQIASAAKKEGYQAFAINSSLKDVSENVIDPSLPSFLITSASKRARGTGKNRDRAKELFKLSGQKLFVDTPSFTNMTSSADVIFVVGSTGGGTGSGVCPELIKVLSDFYSNKKLVIFYGILPKLSESLMSQYNTLDCLNEIINQNVPFMLADLDFYSDEPNDIAYKNIAKHIISTIDVIDGKYLHFSDSGMIDENDMLTICNQPGYMSAYIQDKITSELIDNNKSIQSMIIARIKKSPAAQIERDGLVRQMGVIVNSPEEMMEKSKTGNYDELYSFIGTPIGVSENYSVSNQTTAQFVLLISGMNPPNTRILKIKEKLESSAPKMKENKLDISSDLDKFRSLKDAGSSTGALFGDEIGSSDEDAAAKTNALSNYFK